MLRVYLPATFDSLASFADHSEFRIASGVAFALTPAVREFYTEGDEEELAYSAFLEAARASLRLLATGDVERFPHRRVVLSADVDESTVTFAPEDGDAVVRMSPAVLRLEDLVAIHVDDEDAEEATRVAVEKIDEADLGDEDAELAVGDAEDNLMSWYDAKELALLVGLS